MFLSFLHRAQRIFVFHETLHDHIEYGDIHVHIFHNFFDILKFIFRIKGAYANETKNAFPSKYIFL
jgi:hypothetical protein